MTTSGQGPGEILSQESRSSGRDLNEGPPEFEASVLTKLGVFNGITPAYDRA
jgi:hypothetical protein